MPTLARSVPKPLKVPSLARSVPKPLKVPAVKTAEIRRQFNTRPGENPDTLAVELRQFSCRPEKI